MDNWIIVTPTGDIAPHTGGETCCAQFKIFSQIRPNKAQILLLLLLLLLLLSLSLLLLSLALQHSASCGLLVQEVS
jgi:hypothetical protein